MFRPAVVIAVLAALVAGLASLWMSGSGSGPGPIAPQISGRNNTVLYLTDSSSGLSNSHIASAFALLESRPDIQIYWGSFATPPIEPRLDRVSEAARVRNPNVKPIIFHDMRTTTSLMEILQRTYLWVDNFVNKYGLAGYDKMLPIMETILMPWSPSEYFALFQETVTLIDEVDPAVVVVDSLQRPFIDAVRDSNRLFAMLNPNALTDVIGYRQPRGSMFWKYPAFSSGHKFPVPARSIIPNIWMQIRFLAMVTASSKLSAARSELKSLGIRDPLNMQMQWDHVPLLSGDLPEAGLPLDYYPPNVTVCGPMVLDTAPAEEQDPEMVKWLEGASSTILVCLGSNLKYDKKRTLEMGMALMRVLQETEDTQILWKYEEEDKPNPEMFTLLDPYISSGRLRVQSWLDVDPVSLVNTGKIDVWVHHGGANCYYEAAMSGVKQVIIPMWLDLYNFAQMAEYVGVGIWPGKEMAPEWDAEALLQGILTALRGDKADAMQKRADALKEAAARYPGRKCAAEHIARMAGAGH